jgi:hypothetical protein
MAQSTSNASSSSASYDFATGQDLAANKADELGKLLVGQLQQRLVDPLGAVAAGQRIRQLQNYLAAYKGGYQLADQEVVPFARMAQSNQSNSATHSHSQSE